MGHSRQFKDFIDGEALFKIVFNILAIYLSTHNKTLLLVCCLCFIIFNYLVILTCFYLEIWTFIS